MCINQSPGHTVGEKKDSTKRYLWSKTTLITVGVGWAWVDPPSWKTDIFFLRSLALSVPISRNFQSNGGKFYPKFETSLYTSIWLETSINWYTKSQGPKKKSVFQEGGSTPAPPTLLVIMVVLLHTLYELLNALSPNCMYVIIYMKFVQIFLFPCKIQLKILYHFVFNTLSLSGWYD